jgi:hypothetical protein
MKKLLLTLLFALNTIALAAAHSTGSLPAPLQASLDQYIKIQTALAADSLKGVSEAAAALAAAAKDAKGTVPEAAIPQAEALAKSNNIEAAREAFKPLSATLIAALASLNEKSGHFYEAFCPMASASWLQTDKKIANPYYGKSMLTCGEIRKEL